jgi:hypothetical protein
LGLSSSFEILIDIINGALEAMNTKGYHIRDPLNPEYYIESVYYDPDNDELYCEMVNEETILEMLKNCWPKANGMSKIKDENAKEGE